MDFTYCKLKDVLKAIYSGGTPSTSVAEYWGGSYKWLSSGETGQRFISNTINTITERGVKESSTRLAKRGSIVMACAGQGKTRGQTSFLLDEMYVNQSIIVLNPDETKVFPLYLFYDLGMRYEELRGGSDASSIRGSITTAALKTLPFSFPDIEKQKRIASILFSYDSLIENNTQRIKVLEQMAENLYKEWFVRFRFPGHETTEFKNGIPKGWEEQRLGQFGVSLDSGSRPLGGVDDSLNEGIPSLGAESVNGLGEFDYNDVKLIPHEYYRKMKRGKNTGNDILVYKDGAYIGKTTIFMKDFPFAQFAVNEHVFLLNASESEYQLYLYFTLHLREYFVLMQNLNRNAAQPGLSKPDMNRIKIVVPTVAIIQKFNAIVKPIMDNVFCLASQRYNLVKQRDLLLPRLMSGKLEV